MGSLVGVSGETISLPLVDIATKPRGEFRQSDSNQQKGGQMGLDVKKRMWKWATVELKTRSLVVGLGLLCLAAFIAPLILLYIHEDKSAEIGQFGDSFGMANAVVSFSAFVLLIYTLFLQMNELTLQREEMEKMQNVQLTAIYLDIIRGNGNSQDEIHIIEKHLEDYVMSFLQQNVPIPSVSDAIYDTMNTLGKITVLPENEVFSGLRLAGQKALHYSECTFSDTFFDEAFVEKLFEDLIAFILGDLVKEHLINGKLSDESIAKINEKANKLQNILVKMMEPI